MYGFAKAPVHNSICRGEHCSPAGRYGIGPYGAVGNP